MGIFLKILLGFCIVWIIWYITGGPLRDDRSRPYIGPNPETGIIETFGTSSLPR